MSYYSLSSDMYIYVFSFVKLVMGIQIYYNLHDLYVLLTCKGHSHSNIRLSVNVVSIIYNNSEKYKKQEQQTPNLT